MLYVLFGVVIGYIVADSVETIRACTSCGLFAPAFMVAGSLAFFLVAVFLVIGGTP